MAKRQESLRCNYNVKPLGIDSKKIFLESMQLPKETLVKRLKNIEKPINYMVEELFSCRNNAPFPLPTRKMKQH